MLGTSSELPPLLKKNRKVDPARRLCMVLFKKYNVGWELQVMLLEVSEKNINNKYCM